MTLFHAEEIRAVGSEGRTCGCERLLCNVILAAREATEASRLETDDWSIFTYD